MVAVYALKTEYTQETDMGNGKSIALLKDAKSVTIFVDFENLEGGISADGSAHPLEEAAEVVLTLRKALRTEKIPCAIGRAYGSWNNPLLASIMRQFQKSGFDCMQVLLARGKNSADLELSLDAQKALLTNQSIDWFVIFGGDRDFLPIARRVQELGKRILFIGARCAMSDDLISLVGEECFVSYQEFIERKEPTSGSQETSSRPNPLLPFKEQLFALILSRGQKIGVEAEIWLTPFLRNDCASNFPHRSHQEVKDALTCLKEEGRIAIMQRPDRTDPNKTYSVILVPERSAMGVALASAKVVGR